MLVPQDDRLDERASVAQLLNGALCHTDVLGSLADLPRREPSRLVVMCALPTDRLSSVFGRIAEDDIGGLLATRADHDGVRLIGVTSRAYPGTVPISGSGLSAEATVGDLLLALAQRETALNSPLALA